MTPSKILAIACTFLSVAVSSATAADAYPTKPIRWVVAYSAGGGSDALARAVGAQLSAQLGQSVLIDNRPGGATVIGADAVAKSPADGYTVLTADNGTLIFNTALFKKLPYDPNKDFAPVGLMAKFPLVLAVNPNSGYGSAKELIDAMRKQPGKLSYATPGIGSPHHLAMEMLKERTKVDVAHVAYKGAAPAIQDVVGGQLPIMVVDTAAGMQMMKAGKLKPLATFSKGRLPSMPDVPTLMELGYTDMEAAAWQGLVVPSSTPKDVIAKLSTELQKAIASPAIQTQFATMGLEATPSDAAGMAKHWSDESRYWPKLIRDRQISLD
ncbi:tripartite tricarboxylate transporter substrate binding protein [Variovorax sp. OV329]|uniref:Bug family tripartite tricarboxylate transporter substrate binding protein n=1 Tax=Variovorax sp. OV329 TaxID=1882825 RepID=UPI0008EC6132|nr:tripartite tricarboxylate transporter substrate binding protein [Variovorax sp. OV329]SFM42306.1 Tripartite-type tricarboxylate transporter, receptor component TctC [Variovorax sp. OV329]